MPAPSFQLVVGVDIAAKTLAVAWTHEGATFRRAKPFDQTPEGVLAFQAWLAETGTAPSATVIVCEATSSYWIRLAVALQQAGYHVRVITPKQARDEADSLGRRSKTNALDAQVLAQLAYERRLLAWSPPPAV